MPTTASSKRAIGICIGISVVALLLWFVVIANLSDLAGSDAAGNGLTQGFSAIEIIILWIPTTFPC